MDLPRSSPTFQSRGAGGIQVPLTNATVSPLFKRWETGRGISPDETKTSGVDEASHSRLGFRASTPPWVTGEARLRVMDQQTVRGQQLTETVVHSVRCQPHRSYVRRSQAARLAQQKDRFGKFEE